MIVDYILGVKVVGETTAAQALKEEGLRLFQEGLYEEAADTFEQARGMFVADGNEIEAAEMVNNLGVIHRLHGKWDEAIASLEESRAKFALLGDRDREAQTLGNLGGLYASKGERDKAQGMLCARPPTSLPSWAIPSIRERRCWR